MIYKKGNLKLIFKALFTLEKKNLSNFSFLMRTFLGFIQLIPFTIFYLYFKLYYLFKKTKKVDYIIGCIDVQANIIKLKDILGPSNIAVNLRIEMKGKKYTGYWNIETFDSYDYNFNNEYSGRLLLGHFLFAKFLIVIS